MKAKERELKGKEMIEAYIERINWDWLFFKGQLIFGGILFIGLTIFLVWIAR